MLAPLKFMSSRMLPRASQRRHPGTFPRQFLPPAFFVYKYKLQNVSLRNRQMSRNKGQKCRDNLPVIDGIFSDMRIEKRGQVFTRVGLLD